MTLSGAGLSAPRFYWWTCTMHPPASQFTQYARPPLSDRYRQQPDTGCVPAGHGCFPFPSLPLQSSEPSCRFTHQGDHQYIQLGKRPESLKAAKCRLLICFLAGPKVGPTGRVIGVDMTPDVLSKARGNIASYRKNTGLETLVFRRIIQDAASLLTPQATAAARTPPALPLRTCSRSRSCRPRYNAPTGRPTARSHTRRRIRAGRSTGTPPIAPPSHR